MSATPSKIGMAPPHPGAFIRDEILDELGLSVSAAAKALGVRRATLSDLINGNAALSPEMALRVEKAFGVSMDTLLRMQAWHDAVAIRAQASEIDVKPYRSTQATEARIDSPVEPAVPPKKTITADYIICLEDGRRFKSLKRHLRTEYKLSPEEYRKKWGLPSDYPMVAPAYAKARSALAKQMGLGQQKAKTLAVSPKGKLRRAAQKGPAKRAAAKRRA
jgi:addiction module HigA family antidote